MNDSNLPFKIISINVRGFRKYRKRRKILNWFAKQVVIMGCVSFKNHTVTSKLNKLGIINGGVILFPHLEGQIVQAF